LKFALFKIEDFAVPAVVLDLTAPAEVAPSAEAPKKIAVRRTNAQIAMDKITAEAKKASTLAAKLANQALVDTKKAAQKVKGPSGPPPTVMVFSNGFTRPVIQAGQAWIVEETMALIYVYSQTVKEKTKSEKHQCPKSQGGMYLFPIALLFILDLAVIILVGKSPVLPSKLR
jgi:hypothetical protein